MGIHGLNPLIKKYDKNVYKQCHYTQFSGKSLAMDVSIFLHKYIHTDRNSWFTQLLNFFVKMQKGNIRIIAVFDGDNVPQEKYLERDCRRNTSDKTVDRLKEIQAVQELLRVNYINDVGGEYEQSVSENHQQRVSSILKIDVDDVDHDVDFTNARSLIKELNKLEDRVENQAAKVDMGVVEMAKRLVIALGIPHLTAYGEAEALCASLALHHYVDGVLSRDTDSLVYGTPLFVCDFKQDVFTWTTLKEILDALDMTHAQFVDFCIMCGCDYNTNIPAIAAGNAYKKIKEYGSIESYLKTEDKDGTCLRYKRCREIFRPYDKVYLRGYSIPKRKQPNVELLEELFAINSCNIPVSHIVKEWEPKLEFVE